MTTTTSKVSGASDFGYANQAYTVGSAGDAAADAAKTDKSSGSVAMATIKGAVGVVTVEVCGDPRLPWVCGTAEQPAAAAAAATEETSKSDETSSGSESWSLKSLKEAINDLDEEGAEDVGYLEVKQVLSTANKESLSAEEAYELIKEIREEEGDEEKTEEVKAKEEEAKKEAEKTESQEKKAVEKAAKEDSMLKEDAASLEETDDAAEEPEVIAT